MKVELNLEAIGKLNSSMQQALVQTAEEILSRERNDGTMPFGDTGNMQNEDTSVDDSDKNDVKIVTNAVQARRLYFNPQYDFRQDKNPNAGGEWWEPWISGEHKNEPSKIFGQFLKKDAGGVIK